MNESHEDTAFERELRMFAPASSSEGVRLGVQRALEGSDSPGLPSGVHGAGRISWQDRCLVTAMGLGAAAAVIVVSLLSMDFAGASGSAPSAAMASSPSAPVLVQTREMLAQLAAGNDPFADRLSVTGTPGVRQ